MNCYLISNPAPGYTDPIRTYICQPRKGRGKKQDFISNRTLPDNLSRIICSAEEFRKEKFKGAFKNKSGADTVFVVPELNWDGSNSVDEGYRYALELLDTKLKNKYLNLVFISLFTREQLLRLVGTDYVEMVKSFPHLTLTELMAPPYPELPVPSYSPLHFDLLKRLVISKSGRLEYIKHQIYHLADHAMQEIPDRAAAFLDTLSLPVYGGQQDWESGQIRAFRERARELTDKREVTHFVQDLRRYIDEVRSRMGGGNELGKKINYSVLVVEDDPVYREKLVSFFKLYFLRVTAFNDDDILHAEERIKDAAGLHNIVILDLMYSTKGQDNDILPFNGLDLYDDLRQAENRRNAKASKSDKGSNVHVAAVRIVTAVPRNDIKTFMVDPPRIFTKGNGWDQLEACMRERMDELVDECREREKSYILGQRAPKKGIFNRPGIIDLIQSDPGGKYTEAKDFAAKVLAKDILLSDFALPTTATGEPSEILDHLPSILAQRALVIHFVRNKANGLFSERDYQKYLAQYLPNNVELPLTGTDYLSTKLGFSLSSLNESGPFSCNVSLKDKSEFFPQELDLFCSRTIINEDLVSNWAAMIKRFLCLELNDPSAVLEAYAADQKGSSVREWEGAFAKSGLREYMGSKPSIPNLHRLLTQVQKYLHDPEEKDYLKEWVWSLLSDGKINLEELSMAKKTKGLAQTVRRTFPNIGDLYFSICAWIQSPEDQEEEEE